MSTDKKAKPAETGAARKVYDASSYIRNATAELEKLKGTFDPTHAAYRQCENIDDELFKALQLLGE